MELSGGKDDRAGTRQGGIRLKATEFHVEVRVKDEGWHVDSLS